MNTSTHRRSSGSIPLPYASQGMRRWQMPRLRGIILPSFVLLIAAAIGTSWIASYWWGPIVHWPDSRLQARFPQRDVYESELWVAYLHPSYIHVSYDRMPDDVFAGKTYNDAARFITDRGSLSHVSNWSMTDVADDRMVHEVRLPGVFSVARQMPRTSMIFQNGIKRAGGGPDAVRAFDKIGPYFRYAFAVHLGYPLAMFMLLSAWLWRRAFIKASGGHLSRSQKRGRELRKGVVRALGGKGGRKRGRRRFQQQDNHDVPFSPSCSHPPRERAV